jgi:hypothetical protein
MQKATLVKSLDGFTGEASLYSLSPPLKYTEYDDNADGDYVEVEKEAEYVIVSATVAMDGGPETYIFPSNDSGDVVSWLEIAGSYRGGLNHAKALSNAGYSLAK